MKEFNYGEFTAGKLTETGLLFLHVFAHDLILSL